MIECCVCYKKKKNNIVTTPCGHHYCTKCFFRWMEQDNTCPMCRRDLLNREPQRLDFNTLETEVVQLYMENINAISETTMSQIENTKLKILIKEKKEITEQLLTRQISLTEQIQKTRTILKKEKNRHLLLTEKIRQKELEELRKENNKLKIWRELPKKNKLVRHSAANSY